MGSRAAALLLVAATAIATGPALAGDPHPARFDSTLSLRVHSRRTDGRAERLGDTPTTDGKGLEIPAGREWWVRRLEERGSAPTWEEFAREVRNRGIPGVEIEAQGFGPREAPGLGALPAVRTLVVRGMRDTRVLPDLLRGFRGLESLDLSGSDLDPAGIAEIARLPSLRRLVLRGAGGVTVAGLHRLADLPALRELDLSLPRPVSACGNCNWVGPAWPDQQTTRARLRDSATKPLARMASLERLDLDGQPLSWRAVNDLTRALPGCAIEWTAPRGR